MLELVQAMWNSAKLGKTGPNVCIRLSNDKRIQTSMHPQTSTLWPCFGQHFDSSTKWQKLKRYFLFMVVVSCNLVKKKVKTIITERQLVLKILSSEKKRYLKADPGKNSIKWHWIKTKNILFELPLLETLFQETYSPPPLTTMKIPFLQGLHCSFLFFLVADLCRYLLLKKCIAFCLNMFFWMRPLT